MSVLYRVGFTTQMPLTYQLVCAAPRTRGAGHGRNGTSWPLSPSVPSLLVPIPASEREKMPGRICQLNKSRRKPLLSSHIWSSLGEVAWPLHEPRDRLLSSSASEWIGGFAPTQWAEIVPLVYTLSSIFSFPASGLVVCFICQHWVLRDDYGIK